MSVYGSVYTEQSIYMHVQRAHIEINPYSRSVKYFM